MNNQFIILVFLSLAISASAQQISQIKVGVNGLTCSACTRSVEMSLLRLDFVDSVTMSLENTEGLVYTKMMHPIDFNKIAKAITDAGFSVRFLEANLNMNKSEINENGCFRLGGINFQWIGFNNAESSIRFAFIDAPFLPGKEYSMWKKKIQTDSCFPDQSAFHITNAD